jgi:hypothetical protein
VSDVSSPITIQDVTGKWEREKGGNETWRELLELLSYSF